LHKKGQLASTIAARFVCAEVTSVEETPEGILVRPAEGFAVLVRSVWARGDAEALVVLNAEVTPSPAPLGVGRVGDALHAIDEVDAFRAFARAADPPPVDLAALLVRFQHGGEPQELISTMASVARVLVRSELRRTPGFSLPIVSGGDAFVLEFCTYRVAWPRERTATLYRWRVERPEGELSWTRRVLATGLKSPLYDRHA
jgi:hypothetical protein